jgi:hypothetical protein
MNKQKLPKATHEGKLMLGNIEIKCCILDDGRRIITEDGLIAFFKAMKVATDDQLKNFADDLIDFNITSEIDGLII